jgi:hypothetical protein
VTSVYIRFRFHCPPVVQTLQSLSDDGVCTLTATTLWQSVLSSMARLRHGQEMQTISPIRRPLRIVASGTLFLTHTLSLPFHPTPSSVTRAHSVDKTRGGSASTLLSLLAQFSAVDAILVASLSGNDDGKMILRDLEREGVNTRFCKIWSDYGVPSAWVLQTGEFLVQSLLAK